MHVVVHWLHARELCYYTIALGRGVQSSPSGPHRGQTCTSQRGPTGPARCVTHHAPNRLAREHALSILVGTHVRTG